MPTPEELAKAKALRLALEKVVNTASALVNKHEEMYGTGNQEFDNLYDSLRVYHILGGIKG